MLLGLAFATFATFSIHPLDSLEGFTPTPSVKKKSNFSEIITEPSDTPTFAFSPKTCLVLVKITTAVESLLATASVIPFNCFSFLSKVAKVLLMFSEF